MPSKPAQTDFRPTGGGSPITSIQGGHSCEMVVTLDSAPTSDLAVTVTYPANAFASLSGAATTPGGMEATVTVAANSTTGTIAVATNPVLSNQAVTFTATANGGSASGTITITP